MPKSSHAWLLISKVKIGCRFTLLSPFLLRDLNQHKQNHLKCTTPSQSEMCLNCKSCFIKLLGPNMMILDGPTYKAAVWPYLGHTAA